MTIRRLTFASTLTLACATATAAEPGWYVSLGAGLANRADSDNSGAFTSDFTTGAGTTIPAGTVVAAGTSLGWESQFDDGWGFAAAAGYSFGNGFRAEFEIPMFVNDVDSHEGVRVGGGLIDGEDAGVLITGSGNLGVTVGDVVADGRGDSSTIGYMLNGYYDFDFGALRPYVGAGVGFAQSDIEFKPSGVAVADDDDTGFSWQIKLGATFAVSESVDVFGEYRYFTQDDAALDLSLLPAKLDVENEFHVFSGGVRFHF